jgi:heme/copper-type cytochrome/quinol oxidase subunit 1
MASWANIGWTGYATLSVMTPEPGIDLWILSLHVAGGYYNRIRGKYL